MHAHTHTHTYTHTHTCEHTHTQTLTQHVYHIHTHAYCHTQTHAQTRTFTPNYRRSCTHTHAWTLNWCRHFVVSIATQQAIMHDRQDIDTSATLEALQNIVVESVTMYVINHSKMRWTRSQVQLRINTRQWMYSRCLIDWLVYYSCWMYFSLIL